MDGAVVAAHIESMFKPGMSWVNYGSWHIDHIKPLALFDLSNNDDVKAAFALSNLQPIWALENLRKNKRYLEPAA